MSFTSLKSKTDGLHYIHLKHRTSWFSEIIFLVEKIAISSAVKLFSILKRFIGVDTVN